MPTTSDNCEGDQRMTHPPSLARFAADHPAITDDSVGPRVGEVDRLELSARKYDGSARRRTGRPTVATGMEQLVVRSEGHAVVLQREWQ
jgi:hypothetical protein